MNKKNIFLWTLYDFANSIAVIVFLLYFSQWLVIENKVADIWYNLIFVGSTIMLVVTTPVAGSIADKMGTKLPFLQFTTISMVIGLLICSLLANFVPKNTSIIFLAALSFLLANYFYQFSLTFYNAFLHDIAPSKLWGFISGLGQSAGWLGQIAGLLIALPLAAGGRAQTFLPATVLFFLIVLPMLLFFKENSKPQKVDINLILEYKNFVRSFVSLCKTHGVGRFLLGYFFILFICWNSTAFYWCYSSCSSFCPLHCISANF